MSQQQIWKYPIGISYLQTVSIPRSHSKLTVQIQDGIPCLWAIVDPNEETYNMELYTFRTGQPLPDDYYEYIATYQTEIFVFHVFTKT